MSTIVEYILGLKDEMSPKIEGATAHVKKMEGAFHGLKETALHTIEALGISFAIFKGFEFMHEGIEKMHQLHEAEGQVRAGLESTRHAAGLTFEELEEGARKFGKQFAFSRAEIIQMQSVMLTFPKITKPVFEEASQSILDMATRLHKGLDETAIMVGKALQDPERGITAMRRVGVNFNDTQTEIIKKLVATGHAGKAQKMILEELQTEFAGSAKAAADADPLFRYNKIMGSIKMAVGEAAMTLLHAFTPALEWAGNMIKGAIDKTKDLVHWIQRNKDILEDIGIVIAAAGAAYAAYTLYSEAAVIWSGIKATAFAIEAAVLGGLGTAVEFVNAMFLASPIGWIVTGVAAITAAVLYCWNHFEGFRKTVFSIWEVIKSFVSSAADVLGGLGKILKGVFTLDTASIKEGFNQTVNAVANASKNIKEAWDHGQKEGADSWAATQAKKAKGLVPEKHDSKGFAPSAASEVHQAPKTKAEGQKNINIHIAITGGLVHEMKFITTNIGETYDKIKEGVTAALSSAVNDSQIVAEH